MAVILSSESINSETTAYESVENVLQSPDPATDVSVSDKSSDTPTNTERTNFKLEEIIHQNDGGKSEHEIKQKKIVSNIESELTQQRQQPQITIESNENIEILEQKITTQKSSDDNV